MIIRTDYIYQLTGSLNTFSIFPESFEEISPGEWHFEFIENENMELVQYVLDNFIPVTYFPPTLDERVTALESKIESLLALHPELNEED